MKRIILSLAVFLFAAVALGQVGIPPGVINVITAPSGSCQQGAPGQKDATGNITTCQGPFVAGLGTWIGAAVDVIYPAGAKGDGVILADGQMYGAPPIISAAVATSTGSSTTPSAPSVTTTNTNDVVLGIAGAGVAWSSGPSSPVIQTTNGAGLYNLTVTSQTGASGPTGPIAEGTLASSFAWVSGSVVLSAGGSPIAVQGTPTQSAVANGSLTITKPTGTANGDYLVACVMDFNLGFPTLPSGWSTLISVKNTTTYMICGMHGAGASEGASYVFVNASSGTGMAGVLINFRSSGGTPHPNLLLSASASFTSADVGKLLCVAGVSASAGQLCGTITVLDSATQVETSFNSANAVTGALFAYASDDTTAFTSTLTSAPCSTVGCRLLLHNRRYGLSAGLTLPNFVPFQLVGVGASIPNTENYYLNGSTPQNVNAGSSLLFLTQSLSGPALTITGNTAASRAITPSNSYTVLEDVSLQGGVGKSRDGGGHDGVYITDYQGVEFNRVQVSNFTGYCWDLSESGTGAANAFFQGIVFRNIFATWCNAGGMALGNLSYTFTSSMTISDGSVFENNGGPGLSFLGPVQVMSIRGSIFQWNNINGAKPEIFLATGALLTGVDIAGNYFETVSTTGSLSNGMISNTVGTVGIGFGENYVNSSSWTIPVFSGAGTALPTCSSSDNNVAHKLACVSDAAACTPGTVYAAGGGAVVCKVQCSSAASWKETGSTGNCPQ